MDITGNLLALDPRTWPSRRYGWQTPGTAALLLAGCSTSSFVVRQRVLPGMSLRLEGGHSGWKTGSWPTHVLVGQPSPLEHVLVGQPNLLEHVLVGQLILRQRVLRHVGLALLPGVDLGHVLALALALEHRPDLWLQEGCRKSAGGCRKGAGRVQGVVRSVRGMVFCRWVRGNDILGHDCPAGAWPVCAHRLVSGGHEAHATTFQQAPAHRRCRVAAARPVREGERELCYSITKYTKHMLYIIQLKAAHRVGGDIGGVLIDHGAAKAAGKESDGVEADAGADLQCGRGGGVRETLSPKPTRPAKSRMGLRQARGPTCNERGGQGRMGTWQGRSGGVIWQPLQNASSIMNVLVYEYVRPLQLCPSATNTPTGSIPHPPSPAGPPPHPPPPTSTRVTPSSPARPTHPPTHPPARPPAHLHPPPPA